MRTSLRAPRVFYLCYEFPVLTQTFTILEVLGLLREGVAVETISCHPPREDAEALGAPEPTVLPGPLSPGSIGVFLLFLIIRPVTTIGLFCRIAVARYRDQGLRCWLRGFLQLLQGARLAWRLRSLQEKPHLHAQFVDAASTVAWVAARLSGTSFSITNHTAYNPYLLAPKLRDAARFFSISDFDRRFTLEMAGATDAPNLVVVRQGIDLDKWPFRSPREAGEPAGILSVAALREKKGHHVLLRAAALLKDRGNRFHLTIVGEGSMRGALEEQVAQLDLGEDVTLAGAEPPERVRARLLEADLFVLAAVVAENGDLDGVPISLMEAMAAGVPVVSTALSGIPELVEADCLANADDPEGLAAKIAEAIRDPAVTRERVVRGRERIEKDYDTRRNVARFAAELRKVMA